MAPRSVFLRYQDILESIARVREIVSSSTDEAFESDWRLHWPVARGIEIISEASRHIPAAIKARHPGIAWREIAGIGNVLRHAYQNTDASLLWKLVQDDLGPLEAVCLAELSLLDLTDP